ncbi:MULTISPECIES: hypothetical protein [Glycomyces]|uniref:DUF1876 domain-containing protein n=2 Tax=Glycomyces TaxID=58113 RepID=A0ABU2AHW6_9ACTN|nr:hypothetical protein [Glycomyces lechevalierae]MDR7336791.1 hypothetical protein [Glycomyces lechevalierae]
MARRIKAPKAAQLLVGGWSYQVDKPRTLWRWAWITTEGAPVASVRVTVDRDSNGLRLSVVDQRIDGVSFPVNTILRDVASRDLFKAAEELLLDAACKQLRLAAAQTVEEVDHA